MKVIDHFIIKKGGVPCAVGLREIDPRGIAIPATGGNPPRQFSVRVPGKRRLVRNARSEVNAVIRRSISASQKLRDSMLADWPKIKALTEISFYSVEAVRVEKIKTPKIAKK